MPIKSWIEKDKKRVMATVSGNFSIEDILLTINNTIQDPDFEKGFNILSDHTEIETVITTEQAKMTASHLEVLSKYFACSKWAVVTKKGSLFWNDENVFSIPRKNSYLFGII